LRKKGTFKMTKSNSEAPVKKQHTFNRRRLLQSSMAVASSLVLGSTVKYYASKRMNTNPLRILFLGGTGFIGPHMVRHCLAKGHEVTLFNRGKRNAELFPDLETIIGDRDPKKGLGLSGLKGRTWDTVIDTSGYLPRHVTASSVLLASVVPHYLFISTVAVYDDFTSLTMDEYSPLASINDPTTEKITSESYGPLKVLCEKAVAKNYPSAHTILRPTFIVGPGDNTDRFIHYFDRPMQGGRMALAGSPKDEYGHIDVRDLADHVVRSIESVKPGIYNMVNKPHAANFGDLMQRTISLTQSNVELVWMNKEFLAKQEEVGDKMFGPFPMWIRPPSGFSLQSQSRAVANGFTNRPIRETIIDTYNWWMQQTAKRRKNKRVTLSTELEQKLLIAWDKQL